MPGFNCGNITLPYPNCVSLIKHCNTLYINDEAWCDCMINYGSRDCSFNLLLVIGLPVGLVSSVLLLMLILLWNRNWQI